MTININNWRKPENLQSTHHSFLATTLQSTVEKILTEKIHLTKARKIKLVAIIIKSLRKPENLQSTYNIFITTTFQSTKYKILTEILNLTTETIENLNFNNK